MATNCRLRCVVRHSTDRGWKIDDFSEVTESFRAKFLTVTKQCHGFVLQPEVAEPKGIQPLWLNAC
jgi:hypothetical protein